MFLLAGPAPVNFVAADQLTAHDARRAAAEILRERRFQAEKSPQPLRGVLTWLGDRVRPLGRPFGWILRQLNKILPGGGSVVWVAVVLVVVLIASALVLRFARARTGRAKAAETARGEHRTAADLERQADEAEQSGRYGDGVRLRFRAGLRRLAEQHAVRIPEQRPNGELLRQLDDSSFSALAQRFDEIAYASSPGGISDVLTARDQWPKVITAGVAKAKQRQAVPEPTAKKRRWRKQRP